MDRRLIGIVLLLLGAGAQAFGRSPQEGLEAGPAWAEFQTVWETGTRTETLGTFLSWEQTAETRRWTLAPLMSYEATPILEREQVDLLYPILTWRKSATEYRWQLLQVFNFSGAARQSEDIIFRRSLFPLYFQQISRSGTNDYLAVLPFYGHLENRLFRDRIDFQMFPLFVQTQKREKITHNYLFPVFHVRAGTGWSGWQAWPLFGIDHKDLGWTTNHLGDRVVSPGLDQWFAVWPFVFHEKKDLGTPLASTNFAILPLHAHYRSAVRDQESWLWPFFSRTEDRTKHFVEWGAPWPWVGWADGEGKTSRRFFPLYGDTRSGPVRWRFYAWPLFTHRQIDDESLRRDVRRVGYFLYDDVKLVNKENGDFRQERGAWPFFFWRHDLTGRERLQIPAPLETVLRNRDAVDRNYSPIWAVYRSEKNPKTGASNHSALWNLYRREENRETVRTSFFFGMIRTEKAQGHRTWKLFWR